MIRSPTRSARQKPIWDSKGDAEAVRVSVMGADDGLDYSRQRPAKTKDAPQRTGIAAQTCPGTAMHGGQNTWIPHPSPNDPQNWPLKASPIGQSDCRNAGMQVQTPAEH